MFNALWKDPRTTATAIVGAIAFLLAKYGFNVPADVQVGIVAIVVFVGQVIGGDGGKTDN